MSESGGGDSGGGGDGGGGGDIGSGGDWSGGNWHFPVGGYGHGPLSDGGGLGAGGGCFILFLLILSVSLRDRCKDGGWMTG
jgi:hypothetical protein